MHRSLALVLSLAAIVCTASCRSFEHEGAPTHEQVSSIEQFLFVQNARSGTFDGERLTLDGIAPIIFFSDRPYRVFGHTEPAEFVEAWKHGPNSFATDPPNAILSLIGNSHVDSFMVALSDPKYENGNFSYKVEVEHGTIPAKFEESSLFIDNNLWAAVGGFAAGHLFSRRADRREAAAYSAGATAHQAGGYYYHAAPPPVPSAPPPPPPPPQQSVSSLLSQAASEMAAYTKTASATDASYVQELVKTVKSVAGDYEKVAK